MTKVTVHRFSKEYAFKMFKKIPLNTSLLVKNLWLGACILVKNELCHG